jgi:hypothetical protein
VSQAYHLWLRGDPHARAAQRMLQPRFQAVLQRASQRADGNVDTQMAERCARCHDPERLAAAEARPAVSVEPLGGRAHAAGGIGCESCHGPASGWLARHYERGHERAALAALGMIDTKNVLVRARLCAGCHVGSAENDLDHEMLAAGHPPLWFELSAHQALLTRKHWDDRPRRLVEPEYEVQLWAAGQVAMAEAALALLEARAVAAGGAGGAGRRPWPELAEANCFACHQPLRAGAEPLPVASSLGRRAGVPPWQAWNTVFAGGLTAGAAPPEAEEWLPPGGAAGALAAVRATMEQSLAPPVAAVAQQARAARRALQAAVRLDGAGGLVSANGLRLNAAGVLAMLDAERTPPTWDRLCHELGALLAVQRSLADAAAARAALESGGELGPLVLLRPRGGVAPIAAALRFRDSDREWPAVLGGLSAAERTGEKTLSLGEVAAELGAWRAALSRAWGELDAGLAGPRVGPE